MKGLGRAVGASLSASIVVGAAVAAVVVLASEREPLLPRLSATFLGQVAIIGLLASVIVSVPAGVLGGLVAGAMLQRHRAMSRGQWLGRGAAAGCGIGAAISLLYGLVMSGFDVSGDAIVPFYLIAGAISGALCGLIIGWWCSSQNSHPSQVPS